MAMKVIARDGNGKSVGFNAYGKPVAFKESKDLEKYAKDAANRRA